MERVEYIVDSFKDFTGEERQFVMAAVSMHNEANVFVEEDDIPVDNDAKVLSIGVSVCRPNDEFNETIGKIIAKGKAIKHRNHALYATDAGLINETMVKALLQQEVRYFKTNPGRYLAGYDSDAEKFRKRAEIKKHIDSLDDNAKVALNWLVKATDEEMTKMAESVNYTLGV